MKGMNKDMVRSNYFSEARSVIEDVEGLIASIPNVRILFFGRLNREVLITGGFLLGGIVETLDSYLRWVIASSTILVIVSSFVGGDTDLFASHTVVYFFVAALCLPIVFAIFSVPSIYGDFKIRNKDIEATVNILIERKLTSATKTEILRRNIKPFELRARSRLRTLKWTVASVWAVFLFLGSKYLEINISAKGHAAPEFLINDCWAALFITLTAHLCVAGYERSVDKLFVLIGLGFDEVEAANINRSKRRTAKAV